MSHVAHPARGFLFTSYLLLIALGLVSLTHATVRRKPSRAAAPPNPSVVGQWEPSFSSGIVVHAAVLPNGKVLHWSPSGSAPPTYSRLWTCVLNNNGLCDPDVNGNNSQDRFYYTSDLFCSGHSFLPDGRLFSAGGSDWEGNELGTARTTIFDPDPAPSPSPPATSGPYMATPRWYPSTITLGSGETALLSGIYCTGDFALPCQNYDFNRIPEVLSKDGTSLKTLPNAELPLPLFPMLHLGSDGRVFYAGPNSPSRWLNTNTGTWGTTTKDYYYSQSPWYLTDRDSGSSVTYDVDKVIIAGGGNPPTNFCETIDLTNEVGSWTPTGSMQFPRRHLNLTILADGKVLATGGTRGKGFDDNCVSNAIFAAELWDPATGSWSTLASMSNRRQYHSTALLLIDGRVLVGGNTGSPPGSTRCQNDPVYQQEIFTPPYLFNSDGTPATRPTIGYAPDTVNYGTQFLVTTPDRGSISKVTMVRLSSVTHSVNMNQRINHLTFTRVGSGLRVNTPANGNVCPPGHYMLFVINNAGVPSVAKIIKIGEA